MEPIWQPSAQRIAAANLTRFVACVNARLGLSLKGFSDLYTWSVNEPALFWSELAHFAAVRAEWGK